MASLAMFFSALLGIFIPAKLVLVTEELDSETMSEQCGSQQDDEGDNEIEGLCHIFEAMS